MKSGRRRTRRPVERAAARILRGRRRGRLGLRGSLLAGLGRLGAELLREPLDAALGVHDLLAARVERVAARTNLEVQLRLGGTRLPRRPAGAPRLDIEILRVDAFLHANSFRRSRTSKYSRERLGRR